MGLQTEGRKMGVQEVRLDSGAPLCAKCLSVCSRFEPSGSPVVCVVRVVVDRSISFAGRERIPFYR